MGRFHLAGVTLVFALAIASAQQQSSGNFTIVDGQVYTPGLAIIDSPQPFTPEGGDFLQVAIDVSGDGRLPLPPYNGNIESGLLNITLFLTSYQTGLNLTISNGTTAGWWPHNSTEAWEFGCGSGSGFQDAGCQEVMLQESGSTVKHVNWVWPDCLLGDGLLNSGNCGNGQQYVQSCLQGTARGPYNISIHQTFRLNGIQYYTVFDLPIDVSNSIPRDTQQSGSRARPFCALRNNPLLSPAQINSSITPLSIQPFLGGNVSTSGSDSDSGSGSGSGSTTSFASSPSSTSSNGAGTKSASFTPRPGIRAVCMFLGIVAIAVCVM